MEKLNKDAKDVKPDVSDKTSSVPTYGLLAINHAYNEGKITFKEWLKLSREWAEQMVRQYGRVMKLRRIDNPLF